MDLGILIARLIVGLAIASHGAQKLFGWFGGYGLDATGCYFEDIGFRPGALFALASGACEMVGGILTAIGLLGPVGPGLIVLAMLVAILAVHRPNGFFATNDGIELPLMYLTASLTIAFSGVGYPSVLLFCWRLQRSLRAATRLVFSPTPNETQWESITGK
jgi:putative oxidoreductase